MTFGKGLNTSKEPKFQELLMMRLREVTIIKTSVPQTHQRKVVHRKPFDVPDPFK